MKKLAIIVGSLVGLILVLILILEFVIDLNAYKGQITEPLAETLQRDVEIGNVRHTLLQGPGAVIQELVVSGFDKSAPLIRIKNIIARMKILPLLSKKIDISTLSVNEPVLLLKRDREGVWNIDDLLRRTAEASPVSTPGEDLPTPPETTPVAEQVPPKTTKVSPSPANPLSSLSQFAIDSLRLVDGKIRVIDELEDVTTELNGINGNFNGIALDSPIHFQLSADVDGGTQGNIDASGKIGPISADGSLENVELDLTISSQEFPWEKLIQLLPANIAKPLKELGLSGLGSVTIQPKGPVDNLVIAGEFDLNKSGLQYQNIFAKPEALPTSIVFEMTLKRDSLFFSSFVLTIGKLRLNVSGAISSFKQPVLDLELTSNEFSVTDLLPLFPEVLDENVLSTEGVGIIKASAKGPVDELALQLAVSLDKSAITYSDIFQKAVQTPTNLLVEALLGKDSVAIKNLVLTLDNLQLTATGEMSNFKKPDLDVVLETNDFDVETLLAHFPIMTEKYLPKELTMAGPGKLRLVAAGPVDNLNLSGSVDMSKGQISFGEYFSKPTDIPGVIDFDTTLTRDTVELRRVQININDVLFDITGLISGLRQQAMLDLSLTSSRFALNQLLPIAGMDMRPSGTTELDVTIQGPLKQIDLLSVAAAKVQCLDVGFFISKFNQPVQHLNVLAELRDQRLTVQQFSGVIGNSSLDGDFTISQVFTRPDITFAVHASHFDFDELIKTDSSVFGTSPASPFRFVADRQTVPISGSPSQPRASPKEEKFSLRDVWHLSNITANGTVLIDKGLAQNIHFSDLTADVEAQNQLVLIENLLFRLYNGNYQGNIQLDLSSQEPEYTLHTELIHVDTNEILSDSTSLSDVLYGLLFANTSLQGQGTKTEQVVNTLSGNGRIKIENGKFTTFDIWPQLAQIFQLIGSISQSDALRQIGDEFNQFPEETHFSRLEGSFHLQDGRAGSSDIILEIPERDMHIALLLDGEFGLNLSLDFLGKIRFSEQSKYYQDMKKYFHDFKQADGSIELPFPIPIGGTLLEPQISMESMQKGMTKFAKELAKQEVQTQLEKAGKALLQELFK